MGFFSDSAVIIEVLLDIVSGSSLVWSGWFSLCDLVNFLFSVMFFYSIGLGMHSGI